jgi:hypothetical protein
MIERGGQVVLRVLENVRQVTIQPIIEKFIKPGTLVNTDEYNIYGQLTQWGYEHKSVCHGHGEWARDEDGDAPNIFRARSACQYDGRLLVIITELVTSSSRNFAGTSTDLCRFFSVYSQCPQTRELSTPSPGGSTRLHQPGTGVEP